jgi:ER membrane protein complex subunit 10
LDASNPEAFTSRGNISVHSISGGDLSVNQKELSQNDRKLLADLGKKNKFYRLKADVVGSDGIKTTFLTSSKAVSFAVLNFYTNFNEISFQCQLIHSQLNEILYVTFDHNSAVIGINHRPVNLEATPDNCNSITDNDIDLLYEFSTVVTLKTIEFAPVPDTVGFISKMEKEREAHDRGETKDTRSFIAKYWMYIVPAVILLLISGVTNPEAPAAGSGVAAR